MPAGGMLSRFDAHALCHGNLIGLDQNPTLLSGNKSMGATLGALRFTASFDCKFINRLANAWRGRWPFDYQSTFPPFADCKAPKADICLERTLGPLDSIIENALSELVRHAVRVEVHTS
jgi:hypothetical protein